MNFVLHGIGAYIFNSRRIYAHFDLYKICAYMFNSRRICAQDLYSILLDYFWMKDPLGMLEDSLWSMILLKSALGDDSDLPLSLDGVRLTEEEVSSRDFLMVCCSLGNFHRGNDCRCLA